MLRNALRAPALTRRAAQLLARASSSYQLETVTTTPHSPAHNTTLHFVSPSAPDQPRSLSLPNLFLRDASIHPDHVHPASQQRLFRTSDIPQDGKLIGYGVHELPGHGDCLVTEWSTPLKGSATMPTTSAKLSVVPVDFLVGVMLGDADHARSEGTLPAPRTWDRAQLERTLVRMPYDAFRSDDAALATTLDALIQDGIVFLTGVPTAEREGHHTELRRLVERIGSLRRTWYGDLWDVKAVENSLNIAYTNLDLGLHMDLTLVHFDNPPRYQFLHSLQNTAVVGGLSYFVDTYALATHLHTHSPSTFSTLASEPMLFSYRNGPHHTRFVRPTFELVPGSSHTLHAVNYSPPFQGPLPLQHIARHARDVDTASDDAPRLARLHDALGEFAALCDDKDARWRFEHQLSEGECVVFDNRRVLHARTAFEFVRRQGDEKAEGGEEPGRWLKGAYMDGDELWSRWRVLQAQEKARAEKERTKGRTLFV
ncbi:hypothetical protein Rhopal_003967-T1 [Rhodotorula paludigena]|uniref:TauD/TfdA-like domain-containing protein n=1 Tax=Rhodotorula paludigena TaxID=86838 RepID=A0AAV5GQK2_9BASI|nr:hypothetical protein Rhopal_003967-T1 [Rhodotorula paludigena]